MFTELLQRVFMSDGELAGQTKSIYIGVDVGVSGALAAIDGEGNILSLEDMPTELKKNKRKRVDGRALNDWVHKVVSENVPCKVLCVVEAVASMPRDGSASAFSFGDSLGVIRGVMCCHLFRTEFVTPVVWKRHHKMLGTDKDYARTVAKNRLPTAKLPFKKDHGKADALLMAIYGMEKWG